MAASRTAASSTATASHRSDLPAEVPAGADVMPKARTENFTVASLMLRSSQRRGLLGIYGFARLVDDIGDEAPGNRSAMLDWLERDVERMFGGEPVHTLLRRLAPSVRAFGMPKGPFSRLIEANRQDQRVDRYATFDQLVEYCDLSANPVGELVLYVFGAATPDCVSWSNSVCTALQLAEHWQDVGEDFRRGRVYLPREDLERFGVDDADLAAHSPSEELKHLLAFEVHRARGLLDESVPLVHSLGGRARLAVAGYVGGGRAALDEIEASGFDVLRRSPKAGKAARLVATATVLRVARR